MAYIPVLVILTLNAVKFCGGEVNACTDDLPDPECPNLAADNECLFSANETGTACVCHKSCISTDKCPGAPAPSDQRCDCLSHVIVCGGCTPNAGCPVANWATVCAKTCYLRELVFCGQFTSYAPGSEAKGGNDPYEYGDTEYWECKVGYEQTGGSIGLSICGPGFTHISSAKYGDLPVCKRVYCGATPKIIYATPNVPEGWFSDTAVYSCQIGTTQMSGDNGLVTCNANGTWTTSNNPPYCIPFVANYVTLPTYGPVANKTLTIKQSRSDINCAALCLQSYYCVGYTYDSGNKQCELNESGETSSNTKYILTHPY